jgi:hypothetical protein
MESLAFLFMIMGIVGSCMLAIGYHKSEETSKGRYVVLILVGIVFLALSITLTGMYIERKNPSPIASSKFKGRTEIVTTHVNGVETSRDTVYIFTPKKK